MASSLPDGRNSSTTIRGVANRIHPSDGKRNSYGAVMSRKLQEGPPPAPSFWNCGLPYPDGILMIHGGTYNYTFPRTDHFTDAIFTALGEAGHFITDNNFVFIPTANVDVSDEEAAEMEAEWTNDATGVVRPSRYTMLHPDNYDPSNSGIEDAAEADTVSFVQPLTTADAVFFGGGRQYRLVDAFKYTRTLDELWNILERGGAVAGTSAGAAPFGSFMLRGDPTSNDVVIADREWYRYGYGFLRRVALDFHVDARDRFNDMYEVLSQDPSLLGIGLSEDTSIVVQGRRYIQVLANSPTSVVAIYNCANSASCNPDNSPYVTLTSGDWYDLCSREVLQGAPTIGAQPGPTFYRLPYDFERDHRGAGPAFLCSGRRCRFTSSIIRAANDGDSPVTLTATLTKGNTFEANLGFDDFLEVQYRMVDETGSSDGPWMTLYDSTSEPDASTVDLELDLPGVGTGDGAYSWFRIQIVANSAFEDGDYAVRNLRIE